MADMTAPRFLLQMIGTADAALRTLLDRHLAGTRLTYRSWMVLNSTALSGGEIERTRLESLLIQGLRIDHSEAAAVLAHLSANGLLESDQAVVRITAAGAEEHDRVRAATEEASGVVLRDLADDDVSITLRTLSKIAERATLLLDQVE
jgi:hypothetical protein